MGRRENLLYKLQEAAGVKSGVHGGDGERIELQGLVGVLDLLGHVVVLQYVDDSEVENHVVHLVENALFFFSVPHWVWDPLRPRRHVHAQLDLESVQTLTNNTQ